MRANRAFARRATAFLAEQGIGQFVDLGSGLPTGQNVHEIAGRINPDARVAYVDNDPVVLVHARALLADPARTIVVEGDVRDPDKLLADPDLLGHIDFRRPVAVIAADDRRRTGNGRVTAPVVAGVGGGRGRWWPGSVVAGVGLLDGPATGADTTGSGAGLARRREGDRRDG